MKAHEERERFVVISALGSRVLVEVRSLELDARTIDVAGVPSTRTDAYGDGFIGFYDWLRSPSGFPVAVRITLFAKAYGLAHRLCASTGVVLEGEGTIRIALADAPAAPEVAADQHMGAILVFENQANITLAIEACDVSADEARRMLESARGSYRGT